LHELRIVLAKLKNLSGSWLSINNISKIINKINKHPPKCLLRSIHINFASLNQNYTSIIMASQKKIKSALISVFSKKGLGPIIHLLHQSGVTIYATGGTQKFIENENIPVVPVEELTDYPSILGGRVKTLHPKVFGGILSRSTNESDSKQLLEYDIPTIDLVVVDLYPFEKTVDTGSSEEEIIEKIDIGGISLIRAAAKNFNDVLIIPSVNNYSDLEKVMSGGGTTGIELRKNMAKEAFIISSSYDKAIADWFSGNEAKQLRYGENPHQQGKFIGDLNKAFDQVNGKALSYNNLLDIDAAVNLVNDFSEPVTAILKHNNACGVACGNNPLNNWLNALASDPVSAFGGVIITTSEVTEEVAAEINKLFFEVCIAPKYSDAALSMLKQKKNRIILVSKETKYPVETERTVLNGKLWQEKDMKIVGANDLRVVTKSTPTGDEVADLLFANTVAKHSRSNTIVLVKDHKLLAAGVGQTSRVDALKQAIQKAKAFNLSLEGAVMASDAFFPFPDCVEIAFQQGIKTVIQPGGSKRDQESIDYCNKNGISMVLTGIRHFKH
jgi:phosphoribosylaminoimidazolecarboxamide formyltransferase / IMP cyclohydrolase